MPGTGDRTSTDDGIEVYPRLPIPKGGGKRDSEPAMSRGGKPAASKKPWIAGGAAVAGIVVGFVVRPMVITDSRIGEAEDKAAAAAKAADEQKTRGDDLASKHRKLELDKIAVEEKLMDATKVQKELAGRVAETQAIVKQQADISAKLQAAVDKSIGLVSADGDEITLRLVDKVLFKTLEDQLTEPGKKVLDKVAVALKEIPDKQIWVQGHTDDQPIGRLPAPPPKGVWGQSPKKTQKPEPSPAAKFATNWELSAARALTVVHYLQDVAKVDPSRLAALAFGQYRPVSKVNKAANRRIEIVLYPKPIVKK